MKLVEVVPNFSCGRDEKMLDEIVFPGRRLGPGPERRLSRFGAPVRGTTERDREAGHRPGFERHRLEPEQNLLAARYEP